VVLVEEQASCYHISIYVAVLVTLVAPASPLALGFPERVAALPASDSRKPRYRATHLGLQTLRGTQRVKSQGFVGVGSGRQRIPTVSANESFPPRRRLPRAGPALSANAESNDGNPPYPCRTLIDTRYAFAARQRVQSAEVKGLATRAQQGRLKPLLTLIRDDTMGRSEVWSPAQECHASGLSVGKNTAFTGWCH
jgi:hypothetical protein